MATRKSQEDTSFRDKSGVIRTYWTERENSKWYHSPRVNGSLKLRSNYCDMERGVQVLVPESTRTFLIARDHGFAKLSTPPLIARYEPTAKNKALSRFRGKIYKGNAALGVTLGSYSQSRDMVVDRYRTLNGDITRRSSELADHLARGRFKHGAKAFAGTHLEVIFGWQPLFSDIYAATTTVIQGAEHQQAVTGRASTDVDFLSHTGNVARTIGTLSCTVSSIVTVTNRNKWLAERAGLLNPATVAWDLVPWSFLVNMFVNVNTLVNQVTDYSGLTFDNESYTRTTELTRIHKAGNSGEHVVRYEKHKLRTVGSIPRPSLEFKIPELSWGTAAMAASLFTQKLSLFQKLGSKLIYLSKKV